MHPVLRIIALMCLAVAISNAMFLLLAGPIILLLGLCFGRSALWSLFKRTRLLMLMLVLVYAFSTPGEYVMHHAWLPTPTFEGISQGAFQALRLLLMLAGVALLLSTTSRESLIASFYLILRPFGSQAERFAVRLWLTLDYVESNKPLFKAMQIKTLLDEMTHNNNYNHVEENTLQVALPLFKKLDWLMLVMIILLTGALYAVRIRA